MNGHGAAAAGPSQPIIGLIGMGDMGKMYARRLDAGGFTKIYVCDREDRFEALKDELKGTNITVLPTGHAVARLADLLVFSVESAALASVVKAYGPSCKPGATVAGQTSVKAPEKEAFERWLPDDVHIVSVHSLHGPTVTTEGQPMVIIHHRGPEEKVRLVEDTFRCFKSRYVYLSYDEHDMVTANTQAVTHAAFLSMGTAWRCSAAYPWETTRYVSGIEVIKVNLTLRIYSAKWHVYAGLALLNPSAQTQIKQFSHSTTELFQLMITNKASELSQRIWEAREKVFGWKREEDGGEKDGRAPILLREELLDQFSLGSKEEMGKEKEAPNSHLSLLAMVDCWAKLGIRPFEHLEVAGTPVFMLWIGVAEYLFRTRSLLSAAIAAALADRVHRPDDVEFVVAARGWSECVSFGNFDLYGRRFQETANFFAPRFDEATQVGSRMIRAIQDAQAHGVVEERPMKRFRGGHQAP